MPKGENQKKKLLTMERIFREETDINHPLSMKDIVTLLANMEIDVNPRTIYDDFEVLREHGMTISPCGEGRARKYYLEPSCRDFNPTELRLLADSVAASRFISEPESRKLIDKLGNLCSRYEAAVLRGNVLLSSRPKSGDEGGELQKSVVEIQNAIRNNHKIRFQYWQWQPDKKRALKHNGDEYCLNPLHLAWFEENYYMVAFDQDDAREKHFRVDKMLNVHETQQPRLASKKVSSFDASGYMRKLFSMFGGEPKTVKLEITEHYAGVIIDRFGADIPIVPNGNGLYTATFEVVPSKQFLGWILSLGSDVRIVYPESVIADMRTLLREQAGIYDV